MAGIFGFFDYTKPGKGVSRDEPVKPRFLFFWELFFRKFWKLVQLNLLYIVFCMPILTVGPATAGFTYVLRNLATEQPVFLFSDFWDGFKNNFLQSTLYSLLLAVCSVMLRVSLMFYTENSAASIWMYVPAGLCAMLGIIFIFMSFYVFLMIVTIELPLRLILRNAAILSIVCLKTNMLTLLFVGLLLLVSYVLLPYSALLFLFIIPAMAGFIICFNSFKEIKKYAIDPYIASQTQNGGEAAEESVFLDPSGPGEK